MAQGQEGELVVALPEVQHRARVADLEDDVPVGDHGAFRRAGGPGGVDEDGRIVRRGAVDAFVPGGRVVAAELPAEFEQLVPAHGHRIVEIPQAFEIHDDDFPQRRHPVPDLEVLVQLLLVLDEQEGRA